MSGTGIESDLQKWRSSFMINAILGGLCGFLGLCLSAVHMFGVSDPYHFIDNLGAGFLIGSLLLFSLAAHRLDKAHEVEKMIRIERCKRTGMIVDEE